MVKPDPIQKVVRINSIMMKMWMLDIYVIVDARIYQLSWLCFMLKPSYTAWPNPIHLHQHTSQISKQSHNKWFIWSPIIYKNITDILWRHILGMTSIYWQVG